MAIQLISTLLAVFAVVYMVLVCYMRRGWHILSGVATQQESGTAVTVSILIAARNEEANIAHTLTDILAQEFPKELLEIIVIDDHSTDNTSAIVQSFAGQGVKLLKMNESRPLNSYKKKAITEAIAMAKGDVIVTTDADCRMGPKWLATVIHYMESHQHFLVSSPVAYSEERSFFETLQTLEFLYLIGLGAAGIGNGYPSTCNGANLAYRRTVFHDLGGFNGIDRLASGDDELFLHKVTAKYPGRIGFCKSRRAIVYTAAKSNLREFISQRKRWASKSTHYKNKGIVALGVAIWLFNLLLLLAGVGSFFIGSLFSVFIVAFGSKLLVELIFLYPLCRFMERGSLLWYLPVLSLLHIIYMVYIGLAGNVGKYEWKGRYVK